MLILVIVRSTIHMAVTVNWVEVRTILVFSFLFLVSVSCIKVTSGSIVHRIAIILLFFLVDSWGAAIAQ